MSVIVKNMKMPKNCKDCQLLAWNGGYYCMASQTVIKALRIQSRRDDCPLVEIPTPHGRLIDADKLNIHDVSPAYGFCVMGVTEEDIELADTVIEAEGSETDA